LTKTGGSQDDVCSWIQKAIPSFFNLREIWKSGIYRLKSKMKLFSSIVMSTLLYGCECWTLTKASEKKLQVFQQKCLSRVLRIFYPNLVSNKAVLKRAVQDNIMLQIVERKWKWV
jgi:hypothetical protein